MGVSTASGRDALSAAPRTSVYGRELSRAAKIVLGVLVAYAVTLILPDILRPTALYQVAYFLEGLPRSVTTGSFDSTSRAPGWYPIASLGFTANNNGVVNYVDDCDGAQSCDAPAAGKLKIGDRIDLRKTAITDRRAANEVMFVAHNRAVVLHVAASAAGPARTVTLIPKSENLRFFRRSSAADAWTLLLDEFGGLFFIGLAALFVWRHPTRLAWGMLLYAVWYNSGQDFVWYANLPVVGLRWFLRLDAVFSAAALTGLLMFALHFPRDLVEGWRRPAERWLVVPFAALAVLSLWSFRNFTDGLPTERVYDVYYALIFVIYLVVFGVFMHTYSTQVDNRPRIRWVILGALSGLLCFLFADVYESTSLFVWLPLIPNWALQSLYAVQVLFPLAVVYAVMRHRVINVRLVLNRSVIVLASLVLATIGLAGFDLAFHEEVGRNAPWIAGIVAIIGGALHERLRHVTDVVDWLFFRRWFVAERDLKQAAARLARAECGQIAEVDRILVDLPADRLSLTSAALFLRQPDGGFQRVHATPSWPDRFLQTIPSDHPLLAALKDAPLRLPDTYFTEPVYMLRPFRMPVLAVPIEMHGVLRRIALYGPHTNDEALDRDELKVIAKLANSAAYAYADLEADALRVENEKLTQQLREARSSIAAASRGGGAAAGGSTDASGPRG